MKHKIIARDKEHLQNLIKQEIDVNGLECDLNHIDVSHINDMSELFLNSKFNGNLSQWNVSNVEDMGYMFSESQFNGDISNWHVSKVKNMWDMFSRSEFNGNISKWDVSEVTNMWNLFGYSKFNGDLTNWKPTKLHHYGNMFNHCSADVPYWFLIQEKGKRNLAIHAYGLKKELDENLNNNNKIIKKIKI
jgi:surface protein